MSGNWRTRTLRTVSTGRGIEEGEMDKFNSWETYCAMCDVFEVRFVPGEEIPEKALYFLSEANPHVWADEGSADPAIYSEFRRMFEAAFPEGAAEPWASAEVVKEFLASMQELYRFVDDYSDDPDVDFWAVFDEVTEEMSWPHFFGVEPFVGKVNPKALQDDELALLRSLVGGTMGKYQHGSSVHMGNGVWEYVGVEVDGAMYELSATNVCVAYYKDLEDYCPLRFRKLGEGEEVGLGIVGEAHVDEPVGKAVADVLVCTETEVSYRDERSFSNVDSRAVAFVFEDGDELVLDRGWYFQEMIDILRGPGSIGKVRPDADGHGHEENGHRYRTEHAISWRSLA